MPKYVLVNLEDWQVLYEDGQKIMENHRIPEHDLLQTVAPDVEIRRLDGTDFDCRVAETGITPERLEDVPSDA